MGAYLLYSGLLQSGTQAITVIEHIMSRQLGPVGREYIGLAVAGFN